MWRGSGKEARLEAEWGVAGWVRHLLLHHGALLLRHRLLLLHRHREGHRELRCLLLLLQCQLLLLQSLLLLLQCQLLLRRFRLLSATGRDRHVNRSTRVRRGGDLHIGYANLRAGIRHCAEDSEQRVKMRGTNTAEYADHKSTYPLLGADTDTAVPGAASPGWHWIAWGCPARIAACDAMSVRRPAAKSARRIWPCEIICSSGQWRRS